MSHAHPSGRFRFATLTIQCFVLAIAAGLCTTAQAQKPSVSREAGGFVKVEAEDFESQTGTEKRAFYLTTGDTEPAITPDGDPSHTEDASGGAYLEILPDTRRTHADKLIKGTNFSPEPGKMAVLTYRVQFQTTGRYYVWVRAYSTGSEDNGLHVGLDGNWPESGQRMQWCNGKRSWFWDSKQRTEAEHCGEPYKIFLDINEPGEHTIHFSMREDGFELDQWLMTTNRDFQPSQDLNPKTTDQSSAAKKSVSRGGSPTKPVSDKPLMTPRGENGDGKVTLQGEKRTWHKITLTMNGPYAHEQDNSPNPFMDHRMEVEFKHSSGKTYLVPGYFAADGNAANTSAESGTKWRAHFAPDAEGEWTYNVKFETGKLAAIDRAAAAESMAPYDGKTGVFEVAKTNKSGRDLRGQGRLQYVNQPYLKFAGSGKYFLKVGADAPETLLGYADFDGTVAGKAKKVPLKTFSAHRGDWRGRDPVWQGDKGKGLIGAINYLSAKGCNAFSFLTYNAGGDGDNVWPFIQREDKLHYDCSKLDQWGIVFDHGTAKGMYLHFKMQETENDDHRLGQKNDGYQPTSLDGGKLGAQRKLYCRELIARFAHNLALNWNLAEESTQSTEEHLAMLNYIESMDPYGHNRVIHTYPGEQDKKYDPLLGDRSNMTGVSLQNSHIRDTHSQTVKWAGKSRAAGKPWIVAFDESGSAAHGQCPDLGYRGYDGKDKTGKMTYTQNEVRKQTLWGNLMGGGAGVEYYFGYQYVENDLVCEDWRSRDQSWDACRIAIEFFHNNDIPFWDMVNADDLIGNPDHDNSKYCLAKANEVYVVYLPEGGSSSINLKGAEGTFQVHWYNPRIGGDLQTGSIKSVDGGGEPRVGVPPSDADQDWVVVLRKGP